MWASVSSSTQLSSGTTRTSIATPGPSTKAWPRAAAARWNSCATRRRAPHVGVSLCVNPTQSGHNEDLHRSPRPIEEDLAKCRSSRVDFVFNPPVEEMYRPGDFDAVVDLPQLSSVLEGKHRPGHF